MRPTHDRILCKVLPVDAMSSGGILIPEAANGRATRATVLKTGPGRILDSGERLEPAVSPGDIVLFDAYKIDWVLGEGIAATPHAKPGDLFIIRETHLQAVLEEE